AGFPERLLAAEVRAPREDEEQVGETVQVDERERVHAERLRAQRGDLGAAADRARDVQAPGELAPAREHEARQRLEPRVPVVAETLEVVDLLLLDPQPAVAGGEGDAEVGAEVEQLVL